MALNFKQKFLNGDVDDFEIELENATEEWHDHFRGRLSLTDYLGFNDKEAELFVKCPTRLEAHIVHNNMAYFYGRKRINTKMCTEIMNTSAFQELYQHIVHEQDNTIETKLKFIQLVLDEGETYIRGERLQRTDNIKRLLSVMVGSSAEKDLK